MKTINSLADLKGHRSNEDFTDMTNRMSKNEFENWEELDNFLTHRIGKAYFTMKAVNELGEYRRLVEAWYGKEAR